MQIADEWVSEFKDGLIEMIMSEKQGRRRLQYKKINFSFCHWNHRRRKERNCYRRKILGKILTKSFPDLVTNQDMW